MMIHSSQGRAWRNSAEASDTSAGSPGTCVPGDRSRQSAFSELVFANWNGRKNFRCSLPCLSDELFATTLIIRAYVTNSQPFARFAACQCVRARNTCVPGACHHVASHYQVRYSTTETRRYRTVHVWVRRRRQLLCIGIWSCMNEPTFTTYHHEVRK
jgi:hypothetical protein